MKQYFTNCFDMLICTKINVLKSDLFSRFEDLNSKLVKTLSNETMFLMMEKEDKKITNVPVKVLQKFQISLGNH